MARIGTCNFKIPTTTPHQHDTIWKENVNREFITTQFKPIKGEHPSKRGGNLITGNAPANGGPDRMASDALAPRARPVQKSFWDIQNASHQSPYETTSHHFARGPPTQVREAAGVPSAGKATPFGLAGGV